MSWNPRKDNTSAGKTSQWNPRKKKKPTEQIQEYLDRKTSGVIPGGGNANAPMARPSTPNQYIVGQVQNPTVSVSSGVSGGLSGALKSPKPPEDTKPPEYVLTLPEQTQPQAGAVSQPQGPTYTLTLPTPEEQALALEQARKQAHIAAFADQMAAMDAEFWRIAQNPGSMLGANESPYFSLYMKQYQQRARDRETNAYTRATAGTGGYGSSFATMAGDQAYRETMQEFDELAPTLIKSKSERMAEILQEREMLKAMGDRINAESNTLTLEDGTTVEVTDAARELYAGYLDSFTQGTGYDTLKTAMINGGASEADADQAIAMFKKLGGATVADQISELEASPTLSGAQDIMAKAKANGTWDSIKSQVGTKVAQSYVDAINNLDSAYEMLGVDQAAWASLAPEQQKAQIIENAAQRKKDGLIGSAEFNKILLDDVDEMVAAIDEEEITKPATEISNMVITWKNYKDRGYISEKEYNELLNGVTKKIDVAATVKKQAATLGQHASNLAGNVADDLNMSDWWKNFIKGAAKIHVGIVADYNPLSPTFIPSLLSNWKWVRKQLLLNNDQEDAMEELLKAQGKHRGGR